MRKINFKNKFVTVLFIVTVVVWGVIILHLIDYFTSMNDEITEEFAEDNVNFDFPENKKNLSSDIEFTKFKRDPFLLPKKETRYSSNSSKKAKAPIINYKITSVIINDKSRLVILEDFTNHNTEFLHEGESYKEIQILKITSTKVLIKEEGINKEILLDQ